MNRVSKFIVVSILSMVLSSTLLVGCHNDNPAPERKAGETAATPDPRRVRKGEE